MTWTVSLNNHDISAKVSGVVVEFAAGNICGECTIELADRSILDGVVLARVPREPLLTVTPVYGSGLGSQPIQFFLEQISYPQDLTSCAATLWGRSLSARLMEPWAPKINKQWAQVTETNLILQELADLCQVPINPATTYPVCAYCYAVQDQYPSEIIHNLAQITGLELWPQVDGSLSLKPRNYRPDVVDRELTPPEYLINSVYRTVPEYGNRVLVSGDGAVAGLQVIVVPVMEDDACVAADAQSQVRLIAVVVDADGQTVAPGTVVNWTCSAGMLQAKTSTVQTTYRYGELHKADSYHHVTLDLPASSVVGVYARKDTTRKTNLFKTRGGSVSGTSITFSIALDYYDQGLMIDYMVQGAPQTWTSGVVPGDVTVTASVAGAAGQCVLHQSNPSACASDIVLEANPSQACLGDTVSILLKVGMWGGAGSGQATFGLVGCGVLSSTKKILSTQTISEIVRTSIWGGAVECRVAAFPVGTPSVVLAENPGGNLYASHTGRTIVLSDSSILPGTQVKVTYQAGGTAMVNWLPTSIPDGYEPIYEELPVVHAEVDGTTVAQVHLTRTPTDAPRIQPYNSFLEYYDSHEGKIVTLTKKDGEIFPKDFVMRCTYESVWLTQPECKAYVTVRVEDGSEDGGRSQIEVKARDCRTVNTGNDYDPDDPNQIPDAGGGGGESGPLDPGEWPAPEEPDEEPEITDCSHAAILGRTPKISNGNRGSVFGVASREDCPGHCSCEEICGSLNSSGRLSTETDWSYQKCKDLCYETRDVTCGECTISGPSTLNPGEEATYTDGLYNNGEYVGDLALISRSASGYKVRMPSGGEGPFRVKVCYGPDQETCCEKDVSFAPCSLTGPNVAEWGEVVTISPGAESMASATAVVKNLELVATTAEGFQVRLNSPHCEGSITVMVGAQLCGSRYIKYKHMGDVFPVVGPSAMTPGDSAYFAYSELGVSDEGYEYTGTLEVIEWGSGGAILKMPSSAQPGDTFTASWTGPCNSYGSKTVAYSLDCIPLGVQCGDVSIGQVICMATGKLGRVAYIDPIWWESFEEYGCRGGKPECGTGRMWQALYGAYYCTGSSTLHCVNRCRYSDYLGHHTGQIFEVTPL